MEQDYWGPSVSIVPAVIGGRTTTPTPAPNTPARPGPEGMSPSERIDRLRVTATSPDRSVVARRTVSSGVTVEAGSRGWSHHSDASLGREVTAAVVAVAAGTHRVIDRILRPTGTPALRRPERHTTSTVANVRTRVTGPRRLVRVELHGADALTVTITSGTLRRLDVSTAALRAEINRTLADGATAHAKRLNRH